MRTGAFGTFGDLRSANADFNLGKYSTVNGSSSETPLVSATPSQTSTSNFVTEFLYTSLNTLVIVQLSVNFVIFTALCYFAYTIAPLYWFLAFIILAANIPLIGIRHRALKNLCDLRNSHSTSGI